MAGSFGVCHVHPSYLRRPRKIICGNCRRSSSLFFLLHLFFCWNVVFSRHLNFPQAEQIGLDRMSVEDLKKFNKNKNLIKKFAKKYDAFLASDSLIKQVCPATEVCSMCGTSCSPAVAGRSSLCSVKYSFPRYIYYIYLICTQSTRA